MSDAGVDKDHSSTYAMKRALSDVNSGRQEASGDAAKKSRYNRDNLTTSMEQARRVLCPFFAKNPDMDAHRVSCYNKGFNEMARLKQHLVNEHKVPSEHLDYFKNKSFRELASLAAKWNRVYCTLFPDVIEEEIPSPYKTVVSSLEPVTTPSASPAATLNVFEDVAVRYSREYSFLTGLKGALSLNKSDGLLANQINGLPTPPSSAENSPELGSLETFPVSEFESLFPSPAPDDLFSNNFVDTSLSAHQDIDSLFLHDTTVTDLAGVSFDPTALTEQPVLAPKVCLDCRSKNVFKTTGRGPSIHVCYNCYSTDIEYRLVSNTLNEPLQSVDTNLSPSMPTLDPVTLPSSAECELLEMFVAVEENLDEWRSQQDSCNDLPLGNIGNSYGEVDKLFEF